MRTKITRWPPDQSTSTGGLSRAGFALPVQAKAKPTVDRDNYLPVGEAGRPSRRGGSFGYISVFPDPGVSASQDTKLPAPLRRKMELAFHADFSQVRVHPDAPDANSLSALAFTQGRDINFAPGQYNPGSQEGQKIIGHELAHVVQQQAGRVAMPQENSQGINADPLLEREAEALGSQAAQRSPAQVANAGPDATPSGSGGGSLVGCD